MKKYLLLAGFLVINTLSAQLGINTNNPQTAFHVDGAKDNNSSGAPTSAQALNDFTTSSSGRVGIGTADPGDLMEVNSGIANTSGLKFRNLTSATPVSASGQPLGVDSSGTIITVPKPSTPSVVTAEVANTSNTAFLVNDTAYTTIPTSTQTLNIPSGGKAVFINVMLGVDYGGFPAGGGAAYYEARLFIDGAPTNVYLIVQEKDQGGSNAQYTFSTVKALSAGSHTIDVRMTRSFNNGTTSGAQMSCRIMSLSFNASYINN
ncbi:hypothetical protein [Chryseobacterium sp. JUb7]|uniref:hypothetical protein n=1 Tax=Chryseobacterium sp. JUb7 TaxID=2940599 RepID=UPI0021672DEB|nr:hypothetical protein [Chryseobacterium sp. JUb7]MCS3532978.1 hypothetical protein [Chryseobacterium sp. JUb7]